MVDSSCNWENVLIYYTNLSPLYLCSSIVTALVLFFTWWYNPRKRTLTASDLVPQGSATLSASEYTKKRFSNLREDVSETVSKEVLNTITVKADAKSGMNDSSMKHIKSVRHETIEKELTAGLSEEQLLKEKETQATQLEAIYKLLKEKEDQFQIRSMDELQEQLKLYKT